MAEHNFQKYHEKVEKIERVEKVDSSPSYLDVSETDEASAPQKVKFEEALTKADSKWDHNSYPKTILVATEEPSLKLSPIDEMSSGGRTIERVKPVTVDQVIQQLDETRASIKAPIAKIEEAQNSRRDLRLSPAHDALLTDKLIHIDSSLKTASSKVGVEVTALEIQQTMGEKPLVKFLNMLSNSDRQMSTMVSEINALNNSKEKLSPEKLLAVQIKLGFVQQELEFFTNVLNKALEGTKTIMNVQV